MSKGLKATEKLKEYWLNHLPLSVNQGLKIVSTLEKELKALEIIKNSGYISIDIMLSQNYITRKEYDLLKEVLINESSN